MNSDLHTFQLPNGLRVICKPVAHTSLIHCGLMINTGSRDERESDNGVAHFIEHAVFKGTEKRKGYQILNRIENVGGEINAFTTRDKTCFYLTALKTYGQRSFELLSDLVLHPNFPEKEMDKEKKVILEEIEMYMDAPEESIYDDFYQMAYPDHPLGFNILGSRSSIEKMKTADLKQFKMKQYQPEQMVLSVVGHISPLKVKKWALRYFGDYQSGGGESRNRTTPQKTAAFEQKLTKDFQQSHCIMGSYAYHQYDAKRFPFYVMVNLLGGESMNSRLNLAIREKYGYVYQINAQFSLFEDSGIFSVDMATEAQYLEKCIQLTQKEFKKLRDRKLGRIQLSQAKKQLIGQMAIAEENNNIQMQSLAKMSLDFDRIYEMEEIAQKISEVTASDILAVANEVLDEKQLSILVYDGKAGNG